MWLHCSPAWIDTGDLVLPPAITGLPPRTFPAGDMEDAVTKGWYDPSRVYILESTVPPSQQLGRFAFTRLDYNMYEVQPFDLGVDQDPFAGKGWATCARARVLRCVHRAVQVEPVDL